MKKYNICKLDFNKKIENTNPDTNKFIEYLLTFFKTTNVGIVKLDDNNYILKKEFFVEKKPILKFLHKVFKIDINEYKFYKKYTKKIMKSKFKKHIQLPIQLKICDDYSVYLFKKLDFDLNSVFLKKLNIKSYKNILNQCMNTLYYLNHTLKIFHNDLHQSKKIRNIMVNQKNGKNNIVFIDFGLSSNIFSRKNNKFYSKMEYQYGTTFKIKSEMIILFYILLSNYYLRKSIDFYNLYYYFFTHKDTLKTFDKKILKSCNKLDKIILKIVK